MGLFSVRRRRAGAHDPAGERPDGDVAYGTQLLAQGRAAEAVEHVSALLRSREESMRPDDPRVHAARVAYGSALLELRRSEEAEAVFAAAVAEAGRDHGADHPSTLTARIHLVRARMDAGRWAEAETEARAVAFGYDGNPFAERRFAAFRFMAWLMLASVLGVAGRHREAAATTEAMLPAAARELGVEHTYVLLCRVLRAQQIALLGRPAESETEAAAVGRLAVRRADDPQGLTLGCVAASARAFALNETGRHAEAEQEARAALIRAEADPGSGSDIAEALRVNLVNALTGQGRYDEALAESEALPAVAFVTAAAARPLARAEALQGLGRRAEAEAEAAAAVEVAAARLGPGHHRALRARQALAAIRGSAEELRAAAAAWEEHFGPDHPATKAALAAR